MLLTLREPSFPYIFVRIFQSASGTEYRRCTSAGSHFYRLAYMICKKVNYITSTVDSLMKHVVYVRRVPDHRLRTCFRKWARKSHQDSAVRFVTAKRGPERATKTRQYDLLRPNVGQKEPPRLGSTICYGQTWARKSHQDSAVPFVTAKRGPERATETRQYDLLRPNVSPQMPLT